MTTLQPQNPTPLAPMTPPSQYGGPSAPPVNVNPLPIARPRFAAPGKPADANPSIVNAAPPTAGGAPPTPTPIPLAAGAAPPYANVTANTPGSATDYTNKTITPGAGVDRLALAHSNFDNFKQANEPYYKADLRDAGQSGAAAGQIGSGMLRGRLGDIADTHDQRLRLAESSFLNDATTGSIEDQYRNIGIAQQQQGFQSGQQNDAFGQQMSQQQLEELLRNGQFGRSATKLGLGMSGNPSDTALQLSGIYGKQASDAGSSAGDLLKNSYLKKYTQFPAAGQAPTAPQVPQVAGAPPEGWGANGYDWMQ